MDTKQGSTFGGIFIGLVIGVIGALMFSSAATSSDTEAGWTPEHILWAYQSCTSEGGAGDAVTGEGVNNYLQFCKEAVACASHTVPAADINIESYDTLNSLLVQCNSGS